MSERKGNYTGRMRVSGVKTAEWTPEAARLSQNYLAYFRTKAALLTTSFPQNHIWSLDIPSQPLPSFSPQNSVT